MLTGLSGKEDIPSITPITPIGSTHRDVLLPPETDCASSAITTLNYYSCGIYHNIYMYLGM